MGIRSWMGLVGGILAVWSCTETKKAMDTQTLFVGTYTNGESKGIYTLRFDPNTGNLDSLQLRAELSNPSFLTLSADRQHLYAVQETGKFDSLGGGVSAFSVADDNSLTKSNEKGSGGSGPCHVSLSGNGQAAVANYGGGNLAIFDLEADGSLGARQMIDHKVLDTTKRSHVHKALFNAEGLFVADLGLDAVKRYKKDDGLWLPGDQPSLDFPQGTGPRHFEFSADLKFLYVIDELNSTLSVFQKDGDEYTHIQTESALAADFKGESYCGDIHLSPDGRFVYGSNRGENTIVVFAIDPVNGKVSTVGRSSVEGDWPRNFTLDPSGAFVLVANQRSHNIAVFERDTEQGTLRFVKSFAMDSPVCLEFK